MPNITPPRGPAGATFNGGTVTGALTVDRHTDDTNPALTVTAGATGTQGVSVVVDPSVPALKVRGLNAGGRISLTDDFSASHAELTSESLVLTATGGSIQRVDADSTNAILIRSDGLWISVNIGPADGDLSPGTAALWFDDTNGASKLKVKGKSANGTVVNGSLALT